MSYVSHVSHVLHVSNVSHVLHVSCVSHMLHVSYVLNVICIACTACIIWVPVGSFMCWSLMWYSQLAACFTLLIHLCNIVGLLLSSLPLSPCSLPFWSILLLAFWSPSHAFYISLPFILSLSHSLSAPLLSPLQSLPILFDVLCGSITIYPSQTPFPTRPLICIGSQNGSLLLISLRTSCHIYCALSFCSIPHLPRQIQNYLSSRNQFVRHFDKYQLCNCVSSPPLFYPSRFPFH